MTNLKPLYNKQDTQDFALHLINRALETAQADYDKLLAEFTDRLQQDAADTIAWRGEEMVHAQYRLRVMKTIQHVLDNSDLAKDAIDAACLVVFEEYRRMLSDGNNIASSTGHSHRFVSATTYAARARFLNHDIGWTLGLTSKLHKIVAYAEELIESQKSED